MAFLSLVVFVGMATDHEIYPMPMFAQLRVADLDVSTDWYRTIGFEEVYSMPAMAHLRYRKYADVMLVPEDGAGEGEKLATTQRGAGVTLYVNVEGESVDDVADRANGVGKGSERGPRETAWNTREVVLRDPDGYRIAFSEPVDTGRSFEDVMGG